MERVPDLQWPHVVVLLQYLLGVMACLVRSQLEMFPGPICDHVKFSQKPNWTILGNLHVVKRLLKFW